MRTRAAVLRAMGLPLPYAESRPLDVCELELEAPGPGEVLVKIGAAGLCHSDLSVINGSRPRPLPMALGHEAAGAVVECGPGPSGFAPGDHVALAFVPTCGSCDPCRRGRPALCEPGAAANAAGTLLSGEQRLRDPATGEAVFHHVGVSVFSEYVVVSERSLIAIPDSLPWDVAALFGCAVLTGVGAAVRAAEIRPGDRVAVFGLGGIGLAAVLGAQVAGAAQIVAVDVVAERLAVARELGATDTVQAGPGRDAVAEVRALTGGGADHALETAGIAAVLADAYAATRRGGTTVTVGLPDPSHQLSIPAVSLVAEERTLKGSYLGSCVPALDVPAFVDLYQRGRLPVDRLLTHRITLDEINEGFDRLHRGEGVRQVVVFDD